MTLTICTDCHLAAQGYDSHELGYTPPVEPLSLVPQDHDIAPDGDWDAWADGHFSWHPCQGCGSTLGGTRFDYAILEPSNR